jgi:hypothetical protein
MEEKPERDFMIMIRHNFSILIIILISVFLISESGCRKKRQEDTFPYVPVNITVNMDLPLYQNLKIPGHFVYLNGGHRGVFLLHSVDDRYIALDLGCPYQPYEECSQLHYDTSGMNFKCGQYAQGIFEPCCNSKFQFDGNILNGPTEFPMRSYHVNHSGSYLYITN